MVLFKSDNKAKQKKNTGISKPTGIKPMKKPTGNPNSKPVNKSVSKPKSLSKNVIEKPKQAVKPVEDKPKSRVARNKVMSPKVLSKAVTPIKPQHEPIVDIIEETVQIKKETNVVKEGNIGEETVSLLKSFKEIETPKFEEPEIPTLVEPKIKPTPVRRSLNPVTNNEPKVSRFEVKKDPLRMPKFLTGYPKISELRCKQLTTSDIISENKYAYSENYMEKKDYPVVEEFILINDDKDIAMVTTDTKNNSVDLTAESIIPELNFNLDSDVIEEIALTVDELEDIGEISLEDIIEEPMDEISLDGELKEEILDLELEEPLELIEEEPLLLEEDISLELDEELLIQEDEMIIGELGLLEDISLEEISDIEIPITEDTSATLIDDTNLVEEGLPLDYTGILTPDELLDGTEGLQLTDDFEINIEETNISSSTNEEDLVELYGTANEQQEEEEEEPILVKQTFGSKSEKSNMIGNLDMGLTYDIEDLKVNDSIDKVKTNFLDDNVDETDILDEIDMSEFLSFGESEALLSRSKDMDEALKYIK